MSDDLHTNQFEYDYETGEWVYTPPVKVELKQFMGLGKIMQELAEFRRQWALDHPMPALPPKKHERENRRGHVSGKRPSHLPPPDWKDQS